jgi:malate dehydrogenase (oxaloacetate-decarboxylating)(NADP+)
VLFYKVVMSDPARFLPILYDPTVGEACLKFGHIYRRPRGMYLSVRHKAGWPRCCATGRPVMSG